MLPPSGRDATGRAFGKPTQSVRARNNRLRSCSCPHVFRGMGDGCGGLKVGTEMSGGVSDVIFEHNRIDYAGIAIKLSAPTPRGGVVKNITWTDLDIRNSGMVIGIDVNLAGSDPKEPSPPPTGRGACCRRYLCKHSCPEPELLRRLHRLRLRRKGPECWLAASRTV